MNGHAKENPMTNSPYLLSNQSREQLRRIGARGGKAQARNRRARLQAQTQAQPHPGTVLPPLAQTAAQAIAGNRESCKSGNSARSVVSDSQGRYSIPDLPIGDYEV